MDKQKLEMLSPARHREYIEFQWQVKAKEVGDPRVVDAFKCHDSLKDAPELAEPELWTEKGFEKLGGLWMDDFAYDRYIVNGKPENGPWMLFFMYSPYTTNGQDFTYVTESIP
jgi:hypothetical protein